MESDGWMGCDILAVCPWASHLASLSIAFFLCITGIIVMSLLESCCEDRVSTECKGTSTATVTVITIIINRNERALAPGREHWLLTPHPTGPHLSPRATEEHAGVLPRLVWPRIRHDARQQPVVMAPVPDVVDFPRGHSSTFLILPQCVQL